MIAEMEDIAGRYFKERGLHIQCAAAREGQSHMLAEPSRSTDHQSSIYVLAISEKFLDQILCNVRVKIAASSRLVLSDAIGSPLYGCRVFVVNRGIALQDI